VEISNYYLNRFRLWEKYTTTSTKQLTKLHKRMKAVDKSLNLLVYPP
jgi:hypothetical protein